MIGTITEHLDSRPRRAGSPAWRKSDWIAGAVAGLLSLATYVFTAAPNVTLLDSGEFLVAAQHFGVPHPTGYPLWTLLNWIFLCLLPIGNAAWEVAIFSGVCAAAAVGFCAALLSSVQRWCYGERLAGRARFLPQIIAIVFALALAFSQSMWSQAVIAEVYALHALLTAVFLALCYSWIQRPASDKLMLGIFFVLALSLSNHHLTIALAPLPYLLILLLRRRMFLDWFFAGLLTLLLGYLGFAILSTEPTVLKTAIRFFYCVVLAFGIFVWLRKFRVRWKLIAFLPPVVAAGLLPYAYMPLASATNPPMNWGYTRDAEGFFFSINRTQYPGSLSEVTVNSLGRLVGTSQKAATEEVRGPAGTKRLQSAQLWIGFFWSQLIKAFSIVGLIGYLASFLFVFRFPLPKRVWIYFLHVAFVLAAFLQPLTAKAGINNADWWTQMPYHTYTNLIFAILAGLGIGLLIFQLMRSRPSAFWLAPALFLLPLFTFRGSEASSSQRDHWFGWMFGYDILKDLPPGSVVIGGTDPGRFVPTYMIFGESSQPPQYKRDPSFDRHDLYILTQNALGERNYMKYLKDHYTSSRPKPSNAFERWLGRENTYPAKSLILPTEFDTVQDLIEMAKTNEQQSGHSPTGQGVELFSVILKWIWEKNREEHEFFIEESFPILWTYDYAIPHGLIYKLNKTKLESLPKEVVERDFTYWKEYSARLLGDPNFKEDFDAQRTFSKSRQTIANIYKHRGMSAEAERAYREALNLWSGNVEAISALTPYLWDRAEFDEVIALCDRALDEDPNNIELWRLRSLAEKRKATEGEIRTLLDKLAYQSRSREIVRRLIELYSSVGETNKSGPLVDQALRDFPNDPDMLRFLIRYYEEHNQLAKTLEPARLLTLLETSNVQNYLLLARACFLQERKEEFYQAANQAIKLGGPALRKAFLTDPTFSAWKADPEFKKLAEPLAVSDQPSTGGQEQKTLRSP